MVEVESGHLGWGHLSPFRGSIQLPPEFVLRFPMVSPTWFSAPEKIYWVSKGALCRPRIINHWLFLAGYFQRAGHPPITPPPILHSVEDVQCYYSWTNWFNRFQPLDIGGIQWGPGPSLGIRGLLLSVVKEINKEKNTTYQLTTWNRSVGVWCRNRVWPSKWGS